MTLSPSNAVASSLAPWLGTDTPVVGTLTVLPLSGSLRWQGDANRWMARVEQDALALATGSVDAILVACSDTSATEPFNPAAAVLLTQAIGRIRQLTGKPVGLSVGVSTNPQGPATALAVAWGSGATFLRVSVGVGGLMTHQGLVSNQLASLAKAYDAWKIPADAVAIMVDISPAQWLPNTAIHESSTLANVAQACLQGFEQLPFTVPKGFICQQKDVSEALLNTLSQHTALPLWIEAGDDPMACARLALQSQGVLLGRVIEKNTSSTGGPRTSPGIDVPRLEHWVRGLQQTFLSRSVVTEATCQPVPQPLS
ncbi:MAG: BtpA/SgcQ family protein [Vampirovibrionales bacterium]|nr:BtpA/SgcQ family protein [Vampirovibrionales bacterium]